MVAVQKCLPRVRRYKYKYTHEVPFFNWNTDNVHANIFVLTNLWLILLLDTLLTSQFNCSVTPVHCWGKFKELVISIFRCLLHCNSFVYGVIIHTSTILERNSMKIWKGQWINWKASTSFKKCMDRNSVISIFVSWD